MIYKSCLSGRIVTVIAALVIFFCGSAFSQIVPSEGMDSGLGGNNVIAGTVYTPSGQRLMRRIQVRLQTKNRGTRTSMTDDNGNFVFRAVTNGSYTIEIDKEPEFEPFHQTVDLIRARGESTILNVRLSFKSSGQGKPAVVNADLAAVPKAALDHFAKAQELAKARDFAGAVDELKFAIRAHPEFMLAYCEMGVVLLRMRKLAEADEALLKALAIKPKAFAPTINRGIVLVAWRKYAEAEPILRDAVKMKETSPVAHYFLGQTLANLGKFDEAEKELKIAVETGGDEMKEAHRLLAIIYSSRGDKKRAATEIDTYLKLAPKASDAEQLRRVARQLRGLEAAPSTQVNNQKPNQ